MATVKEFADSINVAVDRLLQQLDNAGLGKKGADQSLSELEKTKLLDYLRQSHGKKNADPNKAVTVKSRERSELRLPGSQGQKTVNVEVRKRRVVQRSDVHKEHPPVENIQPIENKDQSPVAAPNTAPAMSPAITVTSAQPVERTEQRTERTDQRPPRSGDRPPRTGDRGDRPPRPAGDRPAGDRPPRTGDRPPRPAGDRPAGDRPPRTGDRPPRPAGDRPVGDRPPRTGDRPPRPVGDRPAVLVIAPLEIVRHEQVIVRPDPQVIVRQALVHRAPQRLRIAQIFVLRRRPCWIKAKPAAKRPPVKLKNHGTKGAAMGIVSTANTGEKTIFLMIATNNRVVGNAKPNPLKINMVLSNPPPHKCMRSESLKPSPSQI